MDRIVQLLINAGALYVAVLLVPNLDFDFAPDGAWLKFLLVAFIFGLVNTFVRPILQIFTLPITLMTLGLFLLVINAAMLGLVALLLGGFQISSFWTALGASLVVSITSWAASGLIGNNGKFEVLTSKR